MFVIIGLFLTVLIGKSQTLYLHEKVVMIVFLATACALLR
jgi:hypothetical protein